MFRIPTLLIFSLIVASLSVAGAGRQSSIEVCEFRYSPFERAFEDLLRARKLRSEDEAIHQMRVEMQRAYVYAFFGDQCGRTIDLRIQQALDSSRALSDPLSLVISR